MGNWILNQLARVFPFLRRLGQEDWQAEEEDERRHE